jgi:hypothetical protein
LSTRDNKVVGVARKHKAEYMGENKDEQIPKLSRYTVNSRSKMTLGLHDHLEQEM